jgi:hypothetical protein
MYRRKCEGNIKIDFIDIGYHVVDFVHLVRDRDQSRAVVNTIVNIRFHKGHRITWLTKRLLASQERFSVWEFGESCTLSTMILRKASCYSPAAT